MKKKGVEFSFGWIFSLIIGAAIIFLALYWVSSFVKQERAIEDSEYAQELGQVISPIETTFESSYKPFDIKFNEESRLFLKCNYDKEGGSEYISIATRSGVGKEWGESGGEVSLPYKHIFAKKTLQGKKLKVFTKPLYMPYKVSNLIYIWDKSYCFVNPPEKIKEEIESLDLNESISIQESINSCPRKSEKICFDSGNFGTSSCDVLIESTSKRVQKNGKIMYYEGDALIYGAIFSEPQIYECEVKRVMQKTSELAELYLEKSRLISSKSAEGCSSALQPELEAYSKTGIMNESIKGQDVYSRLAEMYLMGERISVKQGAIKCSLWKE